MKKLLLACMMVPVLGANAQTVKKVILEDLTGIHCGWCPEGAVMTEDLYAQNPSTFIPIAIHTGNYTPAASPLRTADGDAINTALAPYGYPAGAVDRAWYAPGHAAPNYDKWKGIAMSRGVWTPAISARMALDGVVSVSFANKVMNTDGSYEADINLKFTTAPKTGVPLRLQVYVLEDSIRAKLKDPNLEQSNYSSNVQGGADPLDPWYHNNVLRSSLVNDHSSTPDYFGDKTTIPATPALNTMYTKHIKFTPNSSWNAKHLRIVAFVAYNGTGGPSTDSKAIINADQVFLNSFFTTGVAHTQQPVSMDVVYPNPAKVKDVIKLQYNIQESSKVTMNVINSLGQVVATPYVSEEVKGSHTIQWSAADYNLPAGMYLMQVSTAQGSFVQKINIF